MSQWTPETVKLWDMEELENHYRSFVQHQDSRAINLSNWLKPMEKRIRPLFPGELCFILSDTGVGKTACIQNLALAMYPQITFLFELELPATLCYERFAAIHTGRTCEDIARNYKMNRPISITQRPDNHIYTSETTALEVWQIQRVIEYQRSIGVDPELIIIDYIGLLGGDRARSRHERITNQAQDLKKLAKAANVVVIATSQIHRKGDDYATQVTIHDARDSGAVEESAGVVIGAWRDPDDPTKRRLYLQVLKATKDGSSEPIACMFDGPTMTIRPEVDDMSKTDYAEDGL